jgi:hypothetical protein
MHLVCEAWPLRPSQQSRVRRIVPGSYCITGSVSYKVSLIAGGAADVESSLRLEENVTLQKVRSVLQKNGAATLFVLHETYGLGTVAVSRFAVQVAGELELREACQSLQVALHTPLLDGESLDQVERVTRELRCPAAPSYLAPRPRLPDRNSSSK